MPLFDLFTSGCRTCWYAGILISLFSLMIVQVENMGFYTLSSVAFDVVRGISWALTRQPL